MSKYVLFLLYPLTVMGVEWSSFNNFPALDKIYHPVSSNNPEVQASFNRGLTYIYAFNHDIAFEEFEKASKLEPSFAMAYWGMALALGQNVNTDVTPENEKRCYEYIQQALKLAPNAWPEEQAYISALAVRYTNDPNADLVPLRYAYRDAMKTVMERYPEDLDAATIYAESNLDLDPWKWWTQDGKPLVGTIEAITAIDSVLKRNPYHIGANHYAIHAWEESPQPERALICAHRLETLLPEAGHLLHMPCHILMQTGDYESAMRTNKKAIEADREYIKKYGLSGNYPLHYTSHNLEILVRIYMLMEDYPNANKTSQELQQLLNPYYNKMPMLEHYATVPIYLNLYFNKWQELLDYQLAAESPFVKSIWHYSRAIAFTAKGEIESADKEKAQMLKAKSEIEDSEMVGPNLAKNIITLAEVMLDATYARVQNKPSDYIDHLKEAVALQDQLFYNEPPGWYAIIRQKLGAAFIEQKRYKEAEEVFRESLIKFQRNGRTLFGLWNVLQLQDRRMDAYWVEREMKAALKNASHPLTLELL